MSSTLVPSILLVTAFPHNKHQKNENKRNRGVSAFTTVGFLDKIVNTFFSNYVDSKNFDITRDNVHGSFFTDGNGHLVRGLRLARCLNCDILIPFSQSNSNVSQNIAHQTNFQKNKKTSDQTNYDSVQSRDIYYQYLINSIANRGYSLVTRIEKRYDLIVIDTRQINPLQLKFYKEHANLVIGIDIGGASRPLFPYLIDTLPQLSRHRANQSHYGIPTETISPSPSKKPRGKPEESRDVLGATTLGRTTQRLLFYLPLNTLRLIEPLFYELNKHKIEVTVIVDIHSDIAHRLSSIDTITVITPDVHNSLPITDADLLVCHFGISAYEALYQKVPVFLMNPTRYHHRLAQHAGFASSMSVPLFAVRDVDKCSKRLLAYMMADSAIKQKEHVRLASIGYSLRFSLGDILMRIHGAMRSNKSNFSHNPYVNEVRLDKVRYRDENRTLFACRATGAEYQITTAPQHQYNRNYFDGMYKSQYGKTYVEDYANILIRARVRMQEINKYLPLYRGSYFLDLGCAMGAMLCAAKEEGYTPLGIDVQQNAVRYIQKTFQIPGICVNLNTMFQNHPKLKYYQNQISVISANFVVEHLNSMDSFLYSVKKLLRVGGVLFFSVPNTFCIRRFMQFHRYIKQSPQDHNMYFSPQSLSRILKNAGFTIRAIKKTGKHPERIVSLPVLRQLATGILSLLKDGETFEIIAVREW